MPPPPDVETAVSRALAATRCIRILGLLVSGLAAVAGAQEKDHPCGREVAMSESTTLAGCHGDSDCAVLSDGLIVCRCTTSPEEADIVIRRDGLEVQRWSDSFSGLFPQEFRVAAAHLDADTTEDLVIATRNGLSMGMVRQYWTVCAISGAKIASPPDCVDVEDYGIMGYLVGTGQRCDLLETRWREGSEPGRGSGLYLVGRWLRYERGKFVNDPAQPPVARRYLYSFERERGSASAPLPWYLDKRTRPVVCPDPLCE
jgi:hypothetical protein